MPQRSIEIDTLRGIACIFLVFYHVVGHDASSGLQISEGGVKSFNELLSFLRLPLFTFLSGYVYAYRPFRENAARFLRGKSRRLLIPLVIVGGLFQLLRSVAPGANDTGDQGWLMYFLQPSTHFWFLEALFFIFLAVMLLEWAGCLRRQSRTLAVIAAAAVLYLLDVEMPWLALGGAIYLFPFFLLGLWLCRFSPTEKLVVSERWLILMGAMLVAALVIELPREQHSFHALALSAAICCTLFVLRPRVRLLALIGTFSYSIYLFHVFFAAGARVALEKSGVDMLSLLGAVALTAGIAGPMIVEYVADSNRLSRVLLLGKSMKSKSAS